MASKNICTIRAMLPDITDLTNTQPSAADMPSMAVSIAQQYNNLFEPVHGIQLLHQQLIIACLKIWVVGGNNIGRGKLPVYCEVDFRDLFPEGTPRVFVACMKTVTDSDAGRIELDFWHELLGPGYRTLLSQLKQFSNARRARGHVGQNRVLIPSEIGHLNGPFFRALSREKSKVAFLVARCEWVTYPGYSSRLEDNGNIRLPLLGGEVRASLKPIPDYLDGNIAPRIVADVPDAKGNREAEEQRIRK
ncbi:hypothetical protein TARUN_4696 [Trichoderma arundinaceum]|uniref:Uncharacterized protein n=1 Tax=Trichoderma arundinaceum TaxID=490622 RepID=A0A395NNE1_TRIAR|nr:hypothetical protein TARUN_4696 [Trichoderma arundinaceum]